jgi:hypothetical protein
MGISPQLYRTRIGCFNPNPKSKKNKIKNSMSRNNKMGQSWTCVGLFSALILIVCSNFVILNQISNQNSQPKSNIVGESRLVAESSLECLQNHRSNTFFGGNGLSVNKIQKMVNGNRRSVGYRLAVWNCGRGLVQDGFSPKLHEIN